MRFYLARTLSGSFNDVIQKVIDALKAEGFGILTDIDVRDTMQKKLNVDWRPYRILGACNPPLAYRALQAEDKIGTMLPCNVIVQDIGAGKIEVAAIDPSETMAHVGNATLAELAAEVRDKLEAVLDQL
jgi:uncharacterized protein (DUF302 family)